MGEARPGEGGPEQDTNTAPPPQPGPGAGESYLQRGLCEPHAVAPERVPQEVLSCVSHHAQTSWGPRRPAHQAGAGPPLNPSTSQTA